MDAVPISICLYCFSCAYTGAALKEIRLSDIKNRKTIPILYTISIIFMVIYQMCNLIIVFQGCKAFSEFVLISAVIIRPLSDLVNTCAFGTMTVIRARVLLNPQQKKFLYLFLIAPYAYSISVIFQILYIFGIMGEFISILAIVSGHIALMVNLAALDMFVLYAIYRGNHAAKFSRNKSARNWIALNIAIAGILYICSQFIAASNETIGIPIACIFWINVMRVFAIYNRFIVTSLKGNVVMSNETSRSNWKEILPESGSRRSSHVPS